MKNFLLYVWQLPQHLVALVIKLIYKKEISYTTKYDNIPIYIIPSWDNWGAGISLGNYIFLAPIHCSDMTVRHEYGHSKQSKMLGWLYLIIVGFTSAVCNNLVDRLFHKKWDNRKRYEWYYKRFPEKWADNLGGVKRFQ